jgi:hypothetical protein
VPDFRLPRLDGRGEMALSDLRRRCVLLVFSSPGCGKLCDPCKQKWTNERKDMNNKFDELTKQMAESVTRREALKKFGVGLAGMALASFGLADQAQATKAPKPCSTNADCHSGEVCCSGSCVDDGKSYCSPGDTCCCYRKGKFCGTKLPPCDPNYGSCWEYCEFMLWC